MSFSENLAVCTRQLLEIDSSHDEVLQELFEISKVFPEHHEKLVNLFVAIRGKMDELKKL